MLISQSVLSNDVTLYALARCVSDLAYSRQDVLTVHGLYCKINLSIYLSVRGTVFGTFMYSRPLFFI